MDAPNDFLTIKYTGPGTTRVNALPDNKYLSVFVTDQIYKVTRADANVLLHSADFTLLKDKSTPVESPATEATIPVEAPDPATAAIPAQPTSMQKKSSKNTPDTADTTATVSSVDANAPVAANK